MSSDRNNENNETSYHEKIEEAKVIRKIVLTVFIILVISFTAVFGGGFLYIQSALQPVDSKDQSVIDVNIPIGSSVSSIGTILKENGIIKNATVFKYYVKFKNESGFQAGDYKLSPSMQIQEIINHLKTGKVIKEAEFKITIPEGFHIEQIAEIIDEKTEHSADDFIKKVDNEEYIKKLIKLYPNILTEDILAEEIRHPLEGYLYPATYEFYEENPSLDVIIQKMIKQTEFILTPYLPKIKERQMNVHEFLTMASIIEEEATQKVDRKKIASVFYNRLEKGMPLQTDPTVLYALGHHKVGVLLDDLKVESPYNTYLYRGLPVGPIANAGETSIEAALNPAETKNLYFFARPTGEVLFSETLREHNRIKNKYKHEWNDYKNSE